MSLERVLRILGSLGFTSTEAKVYIYLAKMDPQSAKDIAAGLRITKQQLYPVLNTLQGKGVIVHNPEKCEVVAATPFEEILEAYLKNSKDKVQKITKNKDELLAIWKDMEFKVK